MERSKRRGEDSPDIHNHPQVCRVKKFTNFSFDILDSRQHYDKFCGIAEVDGPVNLSADPKIYIEDLKDCEGVIPVRWLVVKDVPFPAFSNITYKQKLETQLRHANT